MHFKQHLYNWFINKYKPIIEFYNIGPRNTYRIYNIDKKEAHLACPFGEEILIPTNIKEIYINIPKNHILLIIIEYIYTNKTVLYLIYIVLGKHKMASWFYKKIIKYKIIAISNSKYINKKVLIT